MIDENTLQKFALNYAKMGWKVFPLRPNTKQPLTRHGVKDATTDTQKIEAWWDTTPTANIGLSCGASGLITIDLDIKNGLNGVEAWDLLEKKHQLQNVGRLEAHTPSGGKHLIFSMPLNTQLGNRTGDLPKGIDIRGNGGYIVIAPSIIDEKCYKWDEEKSPFSAIQGGLPDAIVKIINVPKNNHNLFDENEINETHENTPYIDAAFNKELDLVATAPQNTRNNTLNQAAFNLGQFVAAGALNENEVHGALLSAALSSGLKKSEALKTIRSGLLAGKKHPRNIPPPKTSHLLSIASPQKTKKIIKSFPLTDMGNGQRLAHRHGEILRHTTHQGWLIWDEKRWINDETGEIYRLAKDTAVAIFDEVLEETKKLSKLIEKSKNIAEFGEEKIIQIKEEQRAIEGRISKINSWAMQTQSERHIKAMIFMGASERPISAHQKDFDQKTHKFNCQNGTFDLKTFKFSKHNKSDMLTKISRVVFDPLAACPRYIQFIAEIFKGIESQIRFVQKAFGYSLSGETIEDALFFLFGNGKNGKTTLIEVLLDLLKDYGMKTKAETLLLKNQTGVSNDIARLAGARLVVASELTDNRLNEALVKDLTGGDRLVARFLHKEFFEFMPQFKLWMYGNHKPIIRGTDDGIWRRIKLIPFSAQFDGENKDKNLGKKLLKELPGIFNWAIEGHKMWKKEGLDSPPEIEDATANYRREMDSLGTFLNDCCLFGANLEIAKVDLYNEYKSWCEESGEHAISKRRMRPQIIERGFGERKTGSVRLWVGLTVKR